MKKLMTFIFVVVLAGAFGGACDRNGEPKQKIETRAVPASVGIAAFFDEHLPATSGSSSDCFFVDDKDSKYLVINSIDELKKIVSSSDTEMPLIDFGRYSLVIGQYRVGGTGYSVTNHGITIESKKMVLNLTVKIPEGSYAVLCPFYYWGLYPKLPKLPISVDVIWEGEPL
jgi:hypothetical protein